MCNQGTAAAPLPGMVSGGHAVAAASNYHNCRPTDLMRHQAVRSSTIWLVDFSRSDPGDGLNAVQSQLSW